jgi:serine O-acetyltransferase
MRGLVRTILSDANAAGYLSKTSVLKSIFVDAGFLAVVIYRFQSYFSKPGFYFIAKLMSRINLFLHGCDFVIGSSIDSGLVIRHPVGIVVGNKVVCGKGLSLMHGVTLGQKSFHSSKDQDTLNPVIGDDVKIGVSAILLGGIRVGSRVTIAAGTLLFSDVPADSFVAGNPSKISPKIRT